MLHRNNMHIVIRLSAINQRLGQPYQIHDAHRPCEFIMEINVTDDIYPSYANRETERQTDSQRGREREREREESETQTHDEMKRLCCSRKKYYWIANDCMVTL